MSEQVERNRRVVPDMQTEPKIDDYAGAELHCRDDRASDDAFETPAGPPQPADTAAGKNQRSGQSAGDKHRNMGTTAEQQFQHHIDTSTDSEHGKPFFQQENHLVDSVYRPGWFYSEC